MVLVCLVGRIQAYHVVIECHQLHHCRVCKKAISNTSTIVRNQFYFIVLISESFYQHFDWDLAVQLLLGQLPDSVVQLLHGNLHAICHFK